MATRTVPDEPSMAPNAALRNFFARRATFREDMNMIKKLTMSAAGALTAVALAGAPSAHADDASYLAAVHGSRGSRIL